LSMDSRAAPFISGVAISAPISAPLADPRGCALLHAIRDLARDQVEWLNSTCEAHFDGADRVAPDAAAIAQRDTHRATIRLIEQILADPELARRMATSILSPE
jgi:hypothetical protein